MLNALFKKTCPELDVDLLKYALTYFSDETNEISYEAVSDFLFPIMIDHCDEDMIRITVDTIVDSLGKSVLDTHLVVLDSPIQMVSDVSAILHLQKTSLGDIQHTASRNAAGKSMVNKEKLRKAEAKLAEKREKRGDNALYQAGIPIWNPDVKPDIIVNQQKLSSGSDSRSKDIKLENFDVSYAGLTILKDADLNLAFGRRYGLVGKNGVGKSTLLRAIAHGELSISSHLRITHVEQEIHGDDTKAITSVLEADVELQLLLKKEIDLNELLKSSDITTENAKLFSSQLKELYLKLQDIEAEKAEARASYILTGLGFTSEQQNAATSTFSGGWRMRLALARALFCRPDLLLADEVTNYLDFPAVVWLETYFQNLNATLLVVSHDRSFLEAVATDMLHLHNGKLDAYKGNFSTFLATRTERVKNQLREYESQVQYRQHLQDFIDRWRYNANRAAQAQSKIKILEKLPPLVAPDGDEMEGLGQGTDSVYFSFPNPDKLSPPILLMDKVTFGYDPAKPILSNVSFDIQMDSKVAIVGPNGAGKSTLIKLLNGALVPNKGIAQRHGRLRTALFSQHFVDQLSLGISAVKSLSEMYPGFTEEEYRRILARYGLFGTTSLQPIGTLSGGQKSRVIFAQMAMSNPHILILDEPTNHLDMDSIDALSKALQAFTGGILIVSHDERFLDSLCREVWVCQGGNMTRFEGKHGCMDGVVRQYKQTFCAIFDMENKDANPMYEREKIDIIIAEKKSECSFIGTQARDVRVNARYDPSIPTGYGKFEFPEDYSTYPSTPTSSLASSSQTTPPTEIKKESVKESKI